MSDIMVDLETLGTRPGCPVLSIGAVEFGPNGLGKEFYVVLETKEQTKEMGLRPEVSTLDWWARQSPEARRVLDDPKTPVYEGLTLFKTYCRDVAPYRVTRVWGNGSDFDNAILNVLHAVSGHTLPWQFWNSRCFRTLKNLAKAIPPPARTGTYHNALDDAKTQAEHAILILNALELWE